MDARAGQTNGLLGAVEPGVLSMVTGTHTGLVALRVEVLAAAPVAMGDWDDVVEASVDVRATTISLRAFEWSTSFTIPGSGWYRARWSDSGATEARDHERYDASEPVVERCLLQLWPAPPAPDAILRETSPYASYWHAEARKRAAPPSVEERAIAEDQARVEREAQEQAWARQAELGRWGGREPSARLLEVETDAVSLIPEGGRDLVDTLAALPPTAQRALALTLVRRACAEAGDGTLDWQPALDALERGRPLPAPFRTSGEAYAAAFPGPTTVTASFSPGLLARGSRPARQPLHPASAAVGAVLAAGRPDPLAAVLRTVHAVSWSAPDLDDYFAAIARRAASAGR